MPDPEVDLKKGTGGFPGDCVYPPRKGDALPMLRLASGPGRNPETVERSVMVLRIWQDKGLAITGVLQRLFSALTEKCCLIPVFFLFPEVLGFVLLRIIGLIKKPDGDHLRHPALRFKMLFIFSSLGTPLFSV